MFRATPFVARKWFASRTLPLAAPAASPSSAPHSASPHKTTIAHHIHRSQELLSEGDSVAALQHLSAVKALRASVATSHNNNERHPHRHHHHRLPRTPFSNNAVPLAARRDAAVDYLRALCFLHQREPLQARQALLECLRADPYGHSEARTLLQRLQTEQAATAALPQALAEAEPLFATIYEGLRQHSMLHWPRLFALYSHAVSLCEANVAGDFVECGVAGGGSAVMLATVAAHMADKGVCAPRTVRAFDTYTGMPPPTLELDTLHGGTVAAADTHWSTGTCASSMQSVSELAQQYGLREGKDIELIPGLFQDSLQQYYPVISASHNKSENHQPIALLHMDSDWYDSTHCCLDHLYPRVKADAGIIQFDDYHYWDGCRAAVQDYFHRHSLSLTALQEVDSNAVWFRKH